MNETGKFYKPFKEMTGAEIQPHLSEIWGFFADRPLSRQEQMAILMIFYEGRYCESGRGMTDIKKWKSLSDDLFDLGKRHLDGRV